MTRMRMGARLALVAVLATSGCRAFCERHYCPPPQASYAQPCVPVCCYPVQACCPAPAAAPAANYQPGGWAQPASRPGCVPCQ